MSYKILVEKIRPAYKNAGMFVKQKYGCSSTNEIVGKMEEEFNLKSSSVRNGWDWDHYFEFPSEKDCTMFMLKWV